MDRTIFENFPHRNKKFLLIIAISQKWTKIGLLNKIFQMLPHIKFFSIFAIVTISMHDEISFSACFGQKTFFDFTYYRVSNFCLVLGNVGWTKYGWSHEKFLKTANVAKDMYFKAYLRYFS